MVTERCVRICFQQPVPTCANAVVLDLLEPLFWMHHAVSDRPHINNRVCTQVCPMTDG